MIADIVSIDALEDMIQEREITYRNGYLIGILSVCRLATFYVNVGVTG